MPVYIANKGYLAVRKETTKGTPAGTPNVYIPYYKDSIITDIAQDEDTPIMGNKFARFQSLLGLRSHGGDITVKAEPNTAGYLLDMILKKGTTTGGGPYTHPFTLDINNDPNSYTWDIQKGRVVMRYMGAELSEIGIDFDKNKMVFNAKMHALKSFLVREVASVAGAGPYTITLKTNYDQNPTEGLLVGDLMTVIKSDDSSIDFEVDSVAGATTLTCSENVSTIAAGDLIFLRAQTPSFTLKSDFLWARTEFRFAGSASSALSAAQTRLEQGSAWTLKHMLEADEGSQRSGSYDPATLARTIGDIEATLKAHFDLPRDLNRMLTNTGRALVIRHFSEDSTYELRVTLNNFKFKEGFPEIETKNPVYYEGAVVPDYLTADGQAWDVKIINNVATI